MPNHVTDSALQAILNDPQSTHGFAPEATAARLLQVLRAAYPHIQTCLLTDATDPATLATKPTTQTQIELQGLWQLFLEKTITQLRQGQSEISAPIFPELKTQNQSSTLHIVCCIVESPKWSLAEKTLILKKIIRLMSTHPGNESWTLDEHHHSINRFYNATTHQMEAIVACPAECFQLVCAGTLDNDRYEVCDDGTSNLRIELLGNHLLKTAQKEINMQHDFCSAGQNHGLLALLYDTYLDRRKDMTGAAPIHAIANEATFVQETLSTLLKQTLSRYPLDVCLLLMIRLIQWNQSEESEGLSPLIEFLRKAHPIEGIDEDAGWKKAYNDELIHHCHRAGLNETYLDIAGYIETIQDLSLHHFATDKAVINLLEIMQTEPLEPPVEFTPRLRHLALQSQKAHACFKATFAENIDSSTILAFYAAKQALNALLTYHKTIGAFAIIDDNFHQTEEMLYNTLLSYYQDYDVFKRLPESFEAQCTQFLQEKARFLHLELERINGAIPALFKDLEGEPAKRVLSLNLVLSDEQLIIWKAAYDGYLAPKRCSQEMAVYLYNRIFLHALLVSPPKWSDFFKAILSFLELELSSVVPIDHPSFQPAIAYFKSKVEYDCLLSNIMLVHIFTKTIPKPAESISIAPTQTQKNWDRARILRYVQSFWENAQMGRPLANLFSQMIVIKSLSESETMFSKSLLIEILNEHKKYLFSVDTLEQICAIPESQLSYSQKNSLFSSRYIPIRIKKEADLIRILKRQSPLSRSDVLFQKTILIRLLYTPNSIFNLHPQGALYYLFSLPINEAVKAALLDGLILHEDERQKHLVENPHMALQKTTYMLNVTANVLSSLFSLPLTQFTSIERSKMLSCIYTYLPTILRNFEEIKGFLHNSSLSEEQLTLDQRIQILSKISSLLHMTPITTIFKEFPPAIYIRALCRSPKHLIQWFKLPNTEITTEARESFFCSILDNITTFIPTIEILEELFLLSYVELGQEQMVRILNALFQHQDSCIYTENPLKTLMILKNNDASIKNLVLRTLKETGLLPTMLVEFQAFYDLFQLSNYQFNQENRRLVFSAIQDKISTLITSVAQFNVLFALPEFHSSKGILQKLCNLMLSQFDALIGDNIDKLFEMINLYKSLSMSKKMDPKTLEKCRVKIIATLHIIAPNLSDAIQNSHQLFQLLEICSSEDNVSNILTCFTDKQLATCIKTWSEFEYLWRLSDTRPTLFTRMLKIVTSEQLMCWAKQSSQPILSNILRFAKLLIKPVEADNYQTLRAAITSFIIQMGGRLFKESASEFDNIFDALIDELSDHEREHLLTTIPPLKLHKILSQRGLIKWFINEAPIRKFNDGQRKRIIDAVLTEEHPFVVASTAELYYFLQRPNYFTAEQQARLLTTVNWETLPWSGENITMLCWFLTSSNIFDLLQRAKVFDSFIKYIKQLSPRRFSHAFLWSELTELFKLPLDVFSQTQRHLLLNECTKKDRSSLIGKKYPGLLSSLPALTKDPLNEKNCSILPKIKEADSQTQVSMVIPGSFFALPSPVMPNTEPANLTCTSHPARGIKRAADDTVKVAGFCEENNDEVAAMKLC